MARSTCEYVKRICKVCGTEFRTKTARQTCSRECASALNPRPFKTYSLCWDCAKATTGECSWSHDFTPVEGWVATPTVLLTDYGKTIDSFKVHECPLFERG